MTVSPDHRCEGKTPFVLTAEEQRKVNYLFAASAREMQAVSRSMLRFPPVETADDCFQDAFMAFAPRAALGKCACLDHRPVVELANAELPVYACRCRPYLMRVVVNRCRHYYRISEQRPLIESELVAMTSHPGDPAKAAMLAERANMIQTRIALLSEPLREAVVLRYYGHCSIREVAAILAIPEGTVKSRLHHACRLLRCLMFRTDVNESLPGEQTHAMTRWTALRTRRRSAAARG